MWIIILIIIVIILIWLNRTEHYQMPTPETAEYVPPNMSMAEYREMVKWIYPGYLND
jgi:hypothetical protein